MTVTRVSEKAFGGPRRRHRRQRRGIDDVVGSWREYAGINRCFVLDECIAGRSEVSESLPESLHPQVRTALEKRGITKLYSHQSVAFERASRGEDLVVATPTASGKSLCYNLPVLDGLARDPAARAMYLFPTKALSRDQEEAFRGLLADASLDRGAITYDGDTPGDARRAARERGTLLITNPDMLHKGILPHHASWARLFANLRYVVIDELHSYRGVFGSHLANVIRRLCRIAAFHGSSPTFLFASATIGNPKEHAEAMRGGEVAVIDENGAPAGPRRVLVYNPPVVNAELGIRASYLKSAVRLTSALVLADVPTLVFGQSRNGVEIMLKYLRDKLDREGGDPESIHAYRGGYLPKTRRRIEESLRKGSLRCVVATNALELGIDIGSLDAVVCAGYPGSIAGLWQRFGRGGRRQGESLAVLVTSSAPLDQYVAREPRYIVGAPIEQARIDPENVEILLQHVKCAAFELPFEEGDSFGNVSADVIRDTVGFLAEHEVLHPVRGPSGKRVYHWASDVYPADQVSLRSVGWDNFVIIDAESSRTIAEMDFRSVHTMLHEQAIYQHEGDQYQVEVLDFDNHKGYVRKVEPDYFTTAMTRIRVSVLVEDGTAQVHLGAGFPLAAGQGDVSVIEKVVGYKKIKYHTHENVGYGEVHLPEMQMHTAAFWLTFPESLVASIPAPRPVVIDGLRALANAMHTVAAVGLMVDPRDMGKTLGYRQEPDGPIATGGGADAGFDPTIFLFDYVAGGIGLSTRLFDERLDVLRRTRELVEGCPCDAGCPACIGPVVDGFESSTDEGGFRKPGLGRKELVTRLLAAAGVWPTH